MQQNIWRVNHHTLQTNGFRNIMHCMVLTSIWVSIDKEKRSNFEFEIVQSGNLKSHIKTVIQQTPYRLVKVIFQRPVTAVNHDVIESRTLIVAHHASKRIRTKSSLMIIITGEI